MHALSSIANTSIPTATFLLLPSQMGWTNKGYMRWLRCFPGHAAVLAKLPSERLAFQQTQGLEMWPHHLGAFFENVA
eukprot:1141618-Pelagomonas_calceolata.AAC.1